MFSLKVHNTFVHQLKNCVKSGIPIIRSLDILSENSPTYRLRKTVRRMSADIQKGSSFHEALAKHHRKFDSLLISSIAAGEKSGQLEEFLDELELYYSNVLEIRRRAIGELFFPLMELALMLAILIALPSIIEFFMRLSPATIEEVPFFTFLVYLRQTILTVLGSIILVLVILRLLSFFPAFKNLFDFSIIRIPLTGKIVKKISLYKILMSFSFLAKGGMDVQTMFNQSADSCRNRYLAKKFRRSLRAIQNGGNIKQAFLRSNIFPPQVIESVNIGEQTGKLDEQLQKTAQQMIEEVFMTLKILPKFITPLLLLLMGLLVLMLALEIYIKPIIDIMERI